MNTKNASPKVLMLQEQIFQNGVLPHPGGRPLPQVPPKSSTTQMKPPLPSSLPPPLRKENQQSENQECPQQMEDKSPKSGKKPIPPPRKQLNKQVSTPHIQKFPQKEEKMVIERSFTSIGKTKQSHSRENSPKNQRNIPVLPERPKRGPIRSPSPSHPHRNVRPTRPPPPLPILHQRSVFNGNFGRNATAEEDVGRPPTRDRSRTFCSPTAAPPVSKSMRELDPKRKSQSFSESGNSSKAGKELPSDAFHCIVLGSTNSGFDSFMKILKLFGEEHSHFQIVIQSQETKKNIVFRSLFPFGSQFKPPNYKDQLTKLPEQNTIFLVLSSGSSREVKLWKNDILHSRQKNPNVVLAFKRPVTLNYQQASELSFKIGAYTHCEFDISPSSIQSVVDLIFQAIGTDFGKRELRQKKFLARTMSLDDLQMNPFKNNKSKLSNPPSPQEEMKDTLTKLLERGARGDTLDDVDMKVMRSLLFDYPKKLVKKCQARVHRKNSGWFSSYDYKLSKYFFHFRIKKNGLNSPQHHSLVIHNNTSSASSFKFEKNHHLSTLGFVSFCPSEGEIPKGKSVTIKLSCVGFTQGLMKEVFTLLIQDKAGQAKETFFVPVKVEAESSNNSQSFWEVDSKEIDTLKCIGSGASAAVYLCTLWGVHVAVKKWEFGRLEPPPKDFECELDTLVGLRNQYSVSLVGVVTKHPGRAMIIMEYVDLGSLDVVLKDKSIELPWKTRVKMALDIAKGMLLMHETGRMHRDLKSLNLLVDSNFNVKIADFGESKDLMSLYTMTKGVGTYFWMAPEVIRKEKYSFEADVYSYGIIMWELFTRKLPERSLQDISEGKSPKISKDFPPEYASIVEQCWNEPEKRPSFKELAFMIENYYKTLTAEEDEKAEKVIERAIRMSSYFFSDENLDTPKVQDAGDYW